MKIVKPRKIIIDCDPGHDDMAAIILAAFSEKLELEAVTTVSGNAPLKNTTQNALEIISAFAPNVPVYEGAKAALIHRYEYPTQFHGESGMDSAGVKLAKTAIVSENGHAALEIIRRVNSQPGEITLVALAPMTNLALALAIDPSIAKTIKEIVFMGGGTSGGNVTAAAEFNIWADAEAAKMVLNSGVKCTMFGLNLTMRAELFESDLKAINSAVTGDNPVSDILEFYTSNSGGGQTGASRKSALHDPCPVAFLINEDLFDVNKYPVEVITSTGSNYGATLVDTRGYRDKPGQKEICVATNANFEALRAMLVEALCKAARIAASQVH